MLQYWSSPTSKVKGTLVSIMAKFFATGTRFVHMKIFVLLGLFSLFLGYGIRLVTLRGIRWWTLVSLVTLRCVGIRSLRSIFDSFVIIL